MHVVYDGVDTQSRVARADCLRVCDGNGALIVARETRTGSGAVNARRASAGCPDARYTLGLRRSCDPGRAQTELCSCFTHSGSLGPMRVRIDRRDRSCAGISLDPRQGWCPMGIRVRIQSQDNSRSLKLVQAQCPIAVRRAT